MKATDGQVSMLVVKAGLNWFIEISQLFAKIGMCATFVPFKRVTKSNNLYGH